METINVDVGLKSYNLNGICEVSFNPTDSAFVEKLFAVFDDLDRTQEEYQAKVNGTSTARELFDATRELDGEMREKVNSIFDKDVCTPLFGGMNVYAFADGFPVWANLLLAVMDVIDSDILAERKKSDARIAKYTAKYHKK